MSSRSWKTPWVLGITVIIVMIGIVGRSLPSGDSHWAAGWEYLVAVGTILLALGTFGFALVTRSLAESTRDAASAELETLRASVRPLLVPDPVSHIRFVPATVTYALKIRNVGAGPAIVAPPGSAARRVHETAWHLQPYARTQLVVAPNESIGFAFNFPTNKKTSFYASISYTDIGGAQFTRTEVFAEISPAVQNVTGFAVYPGASEEGPTFMSGTGWDHGLRVREG